MKLGLALRRTTRVFRFVTWVVDTVGYRIGFILKFYWVFTQFYWVLLGFTGFYS